MKHLYVVDGNSLLFRAYYATAYGPNPNIMRTKDGTPTNAIFAFANMLLKLLAKIEKGDGIFIGFDADGNTFRKQEYSQYKANRKPCPEDLKVQFPLSRELCKALGILCFEEHGVEADDLCGTIAHLASLKGIKVDVYTSDKDYLQLIDENTEINLLKTGLSNMDLVTSANMQEKYGFSPKQIIDYKGLRGDASDNLPGIPGVGEKTAVKLITEYGSLEAIFKAAPTIKGKLGETLRENEEQGRECYKLATIDTNVALPFSLEDLAYQGFEIGMLSDFAKRLELNQLLARIPSRLAKSEAKDVETKRVSSFPKLEEVKRIGLALDLDFSSYHTEEPLGIAISTGEETYYESLVDFKKDAVLIGILENPNIEKTVYDGKATIYSLYQYGIKIKGITDDLLLAAYLLDSGISEDPSPVYRSFGVELGEKESSLLTDGDSSYTGKMAYNAYRLKEEIERHLKAVDAYELYKNTEMPLLFVLAKMEIEGFPIHKEKLLEFGSVFKEKRDAAEKAVFLTLGHPFNLNSPKQVADVLYNELKLPDHHKGGTGVDVLSELYNYHPIIRDILEYRKYAKLLSTYIDGLAPHIQKDGKIHSYFNQAQTSTGRLSSSSPNLQNISARDEEGKQIRKAFYYDEDDVELVSMDYHQIELRILAALSNCSAYKEVFNTDRDVHTETAKLIFHTDNVTPLMRRKAKAVNFAIIYGSSVYGLAEQIEGSVEEASQIIKNFYAAYPEVGAYLQSLIKDVQTKGYVTTMFGRRRYLRDINDPSYVKREAAKRAALNAPVQGSAADLIKIAMVKIDDFLTKGGYKTKMVLQIHDELIFKMDKNEETTLIPALSKIMTSCINLSVKLSVEVSKGHTWYDAKD